MVVPRKKNRGTLGTTELEINEVIRSFESPCRVCIRVGMSFGGLRNPRPKKSTIQEINLNFVNTSKRSKKSVI